jgi:hypothetical protein
VRDGPTILDPQGSASRAQVAMIRMNYVEHVVNAQILFSKQYPLRGRRQPPALFRICCCVLVAIGPLA